MKRRDRKSAGSARYFAADLWWDEDFQIMQIGGKVAWDVCRFCVRGVRVHLARLDIKRGQLRVFRKYVDPLTAMCLVPKRGLNSKDTAAMGEKI